jgi:hypothetical protein
MTRSSRRRYSRRFPEQLQPTYVPVRMRGGVANAARCMAVQQR